MARNMSDYAATCRSFQLPTPARFNWAFDTFDAWARDPAKLALLWVAADGQPRTYRVSRVSRVEPLDDPFDRPGDFDLAAFWAEASAAYERDTPRVTVVLWIARDRLDRLRGVIGERPFDTIERLDAPDPDGWLRIRVKLDWPSEATTQILAVGPGCELLEPEPLRERIAEEAHRLAARYDERQTGPTEAVPVAEPSVAGR